MNALFLAQRKSLSPIFRSISLLTNPGPVCYLYTDFIILSQGLIWQPLWRGFFEDGPLLLGSRVTKQPGTKKYSLWVRSSQYKPLTKVQGDHNNVGRTQVGN